MAGYKTNEQEGTRAVLRHARVSPYKVREVLDLVRGRPVQEAEDILRFSERDAAITVGKLLHSAVANAENNDELDPEELYVASCFADEGTTIKRWRPRARGRATRIRKRTSNITIIVGRMPVEELQRQQARRRAEQLAQRARRVAGARRAEGDQRSRAERRHGGPALEEPEAEELDEAPVANADVVEIEDTAAAPEEVEAQQEGGQGSDAGTEAVVTDETAEKVPPTDADQATPVAEDETSPSPAGPESAGAEPAGEDANAERDASEGDAPGPERSTENGRPTEDERDEQ